MKVMFSDKIIYSINNKTDHILEKYISHRKKVDIFLILGWILSRIRIRYFMKLNSWIRIHIKMKQIRNTAFQNNVSYPMGIVWPEIREIKMDNVGLVWTERIGIVFGTCFWRHPLDYVFNFSIFCLNG